MALFDPFPQLTTSRLRLREPTLADAPDFHRHERDPQINRHLGRLPPPDLEVTQAKLAGILASIAAGESLLWILTDLTTDAYLGSICLWRWDQLNARAEIGYSLDPSRWGEGLVPEALTAVLRFACEHMGLHAVEAWTHPDNHASQRVLEKLDFRKEAHFKERDLNLVTHTWDDAVVYTRLFPAPRHHC